MSLQPMFNKQDDRAQSLRSDFIAIINHEFRTTLTSIQGFSELMRDEDFSIAEMKEFSSDINADACRLSNVINQLLDLERIESGQMVFKMEKVDLNAIVLDVIDSFRPESALHTIRPQLDYALPHIAGDYERLKQVFSHLLLNAIKYSPDGGLILLSTGVEENRIHVRVQDQGIGISSAVLEKIFDPYFSRSNAATSRYIKGTGLGLAIAREIINLHGGAIWAASEINQGSTIHVTLPLGVPVAYMSPKQ